MIVNRVNTTVFCFFKIPLSLLLLLVLQKEVPIHRLRSLFKYVLMHKIIIDNIIPFEEYGKFKEKNICKLFGR